MANIEIIHIKRKNLLNLLFVLPLLMVNSCTSKRGFQAHNINYVYDTKDLALRPNFKVFHLNDSLTRVFYRVNSNNLLYMRESEGQPYKASFNLNYSLVSSFEEVTILDSGKFTFTDREDAPPKKSIIGSFDVKTKVDFPKDCVLRILMTDKNRQVNFENFLRLEKKDEINSQKFLLRDTLGNILFKNHVPTNIPFQIDRGEIAATKYFVSFYKRKFPLALPPYSSAAPESFELDPDTTYQVNANSNMTLPESGFYHFRLDTNSWDGFTVYSFYNEFPFIANRQHLGPPLRYLTTKREFEKIGDPEKDSKNLKKTVDEFWLDRSGSMERSKILISAYYSRVQEANIYFSSYLEGWKTDRGIIYVVYGPPDKVYRSSGGEAWVYGEESSSLSYYFNFLKVTNPFSDNDFSLSRSSTYRYGWGQAIESWRNGRVYNSKDIKREQDESDNNTFRQRPPYRY